jgi:uncharacterized protein YdiU (UPF0061 family)
MSEFWNAYIAIRTRSPEMETANPSIILSHCNIELCIDVMQEEQGKRLHALCVLNKTGYLDADHYASYLMSVGIT